MKKAGFIRFSYGIESGSQKMLDRMQKHVTVEENLMTLRLAEEKGVPSFANMVFGMPGENKETLGDTKKFLIEAGLNTNRFFGSWATAYPGTQLFDWIKKEGIVKDTRKYLFEIGSIGNLLYNLTELTTDELKKEVTAVYWDVDITYHLRHGGCLIYIHKIIIHILRNILHRFHPKVQNKLRALGKIILPKGKN